MRLSNTSGNRCRWLSTLIAVLLAVAMLASCAPPQLKPSLRAKLDEKISWAMGKLSIPGALVGVSIQGQGEYYLAAGKADVKTGRPMSLDDGFKIGSVTKTFTANTVLQLVDEGRLGLDDRVSKFVKGVPNGDKITVSQLLNHTSGLYNYGDSQAWLDLYMKDFDRKWTTRQLLDIAFNESEYFAPGEDMHYSNTNYLLLGLIIEKVTGRKAAEVIVEKTVDRLGLENTYFPEGNDLRMPYAHGYTPEDMETDEPRDSTNDVDPSCTWTAGAMVSTISDLVEWGRALGTGEFLTPETHKRQLEMLVMPGGNDQSTYGLGVMGLGEFVGHGGQQPGYNTYVMYYPEKKASIAVFGNHSCEIVGLEGVSLFSVTAKVLWPKAVTW